MYSVNDLSLLRTLDLPPGSGRTATALSPCEQPNLLALPAAAGAGTLRVYDLMVGGWVGVWGCCTATALSPCEQPNLLALPAAAGTGTLRVYDLMVGGRSLGRGGAKRNHAYWR